MNFFGVSASNSGLIFDRTCSFLARRSSSSILSAAARITAGTSPAGWPTFRAILRSEYQAFDRIILGICGGGVSVASTALAMQTRRKLLDLPVGEKLVLKGERHHLTVERLPDSEAPKAK